MKQNQHYNFIFSRKVPLMNHRNSCFVLDIRHARWGILYIHTILLDAENITTALLIPACLMQRLCVRKHIYNWRILASAALELQYPNQSIARKSICFQLLARDFYRQLGSDSACDVFYALRKTFGQSHATLWKQRPSNLRHYKHEFLFFFCFFSLWI